MKKIFTFITCFALFLCAGCSRLVLLPEKADERQPTYVQACDLLKEGKYEEAYPLFVSLGDYKDSALHTQKFARLPVQIVKEDDGMLEGIYLFTTDYSYNEYGECISEVGAYENEVGPGYSEKSTYDQSGKLIKKETSSEAGESTITYEYDGDHLIKKIGYTEGANVGGITSFTYDDQGNRLSSKFDSYMGINTEDYESQEPYSSETTEYYYDEQNRCVKTVNQYGEEFLYTYTVEYNQNSLPIKIISDDGQGNPTETLFKYDDSGRCTEITTPYDHTVYRYDKGDLPVSAAFTRTDGQPCDITYTYKLFYLRNKKDNTPFHIKEHLSFLEW